VDRSYSARIGGTPSAPFPNPTNAVGESFFEELEVRSFARCPVPTNEREIRIVLPAPDETVEDVVQVVEALTKAQTTASMYLPWRPEKPPGLTTPPSQNISSM
jgi:hypothetical protein